MTSVRRLVAAGPTLLWLVATGFVVGILIGLG